MRSLVVGFRRGARCRRSSFSGAFWTSSPRAVAAASRMRSDEVCPVIAGVRGATRRSIAALAVPRGSIGHHAQGRIRGGVLSLSALVSRVSDIHLDTNWPSQRANHDYILIRSTRAHRPRFRNQAPAVFLNSGLRVRSESSDRQLWMIRSSRLPRHPLKNSRRALRQRGEASTATTPGADGTPALPWPFPERTILEEHAQACCKRDWTGLDWNGFGSRTAAPAQGAAAIASAERRSSGTGLDGAEELDWTEDPDLDRLAAAIFQGILLGGRTSAELDWTGPLTGQDRLSHLTSEQAAARGQPPRVLPRVVPPRLRADSQEPSNRQRASCKMLQRAVLHTLRKHKHVEATSDKGAIEKIKGSLWNELPKGFLYRFTHPASVAMFRSLLSLNSISITQFSAGTNELPIACTQHCIGRGSSSAITRAQHCIVRGRLVAPSAIRSHGLKGESDSDQRPSSHILITAGPLGHGSTDRLHTDLSNARIVPVITSLPGRSEVHSGGEAALSGCEVRPAAERTGRGGADISFSDGFPVIASLPGRSRAHSGGEAALSGCEVRPAAERTGRGDAEINGARRRLHNRSGGALSAASFEFNAVVGIVGFWRGARRRRSSFSGAFWTGPSRRLRCPADDSAGESRRSDILLKSAFAESLCRFRHLFHVFSWIPTGRANVPTATVFLPTVTVFFSKAQHRPRFRNQAPAVFLNSGLRVRSESSDRQLWMIRSSRLPRHPLKNSRRALRQRGEASTATTPGADGTPALPWPFPERTILEEHAQACCKRDWTGLDWNGFGSRTAAPAQGAAAIASAERRSSGTGLDGAEELDWTEDPDLDRLAAAIFQGILLGGRTSAGLDWTGPLTGQDRLSHLTSEQAAARGQPPRVLPRVVPPRLRADSQEPSNRQRASCKMLQRAVLHTLRKHKHVEATSDKGAIEKIKGSLWNELPKGFLYRFTHPASVAMFRSLLSLNSISITQFSAGTNELPIACTQHCIGRGSSSAITRAQHCIVRGRPVAPSAIRPQSCGNEVTAPEFGSV
eukprot:tig00001027_g6396.t1